MDQFKHVATGSIDTGASAATAMPPAAPKVSTFEEEMAALAGASNALNRVGKEAHVRILFWAMARLAPRPGFTGDGIGEGGNTASQEAEALAGVARTLESLDEAARDRAVTFLRQRYGVSNLQQFRF
jgi:hypothetical protein